MSTDGFENTFVCVCTHTRAWFGTLQQVSAIQKEGVHLKGSLVLVWGLRQGKGGPSSVRNHLCYFLQTVFANCRIGVCLFYWFYMEKRKKQYLANGMLWNANKMGSETYTVWGEGVSAGNCRHLLVALTHCEKLEAFPLIVAFQCLFM